MMDDTCFKCLVGVFYEEAVEFGRLSVDDIDVGFMEQHGKQVVLRSHGELLGGQSSTFVHVFFVPRRIDSFEYLDIMHRWEVGRG